MSLDFSLCVEVDTGGETPYRVELAWYNYTHNVTPIWSLAGCYDALYESDGKLAGEILPELIKGEEFIRTHLEECEKLNPANGWGSADTALTWLCKVIAACREHPKARVEISR